MRHADARGVFAEMMRTPDCGQFSFFTAHPGVTRGGHYHHTKTEKFLVVCGTGRFGFRHMMSGERYELVVTADESRVVETVPGWAHDVTNVGDDEMIVMLWANEVFDPNKPDTVAAPVLG
jgi:UDP-2-acetamido-2,6-beta-L-arabino-hexul-4-ose reductase